MIKLDNKPEQNQETLPKVNPNSDYFDFDAWARAVRLQMVTALQKSLDTRKSKFLIP